MRLPDISRAPATWLLVSYFAFACSGPTGGGTGPGESEVGGQPGAGGLPAAGGSSPSVPQTSGGSVSAGGSASSLQESTGGATSVPGTGGAATTGGSSATGNKSTTGGSNSTGGSPAVGGATSAAATGGLSGTNTTGGTVGTGGAKNTGGTSSAVGNTTTGGTSTAGGSKATGGATTTGGSKSTGGNASTGGSKAAGGASSTGGAAATGGGTSTSTGADGCTDTLALGVTLSEVAVFQSGKISVMKGGAAVAATTQYGADIVEARPTLIRVYVTTDSGFQSRQLSARLVLNDGATSYYSKQTISASSTELSGANSFPIQVPATDIKGGLNYSVKIVECATGSGTAHNPQFPASGQATLVTRLTGPIKITAVPVVANGITPTIDQTFTSSLKQAMDAMYPTSDTQITVNSTPITGCGITPATASDSPTWSSCLDLVRTRRSADKPANDVYYLGIVTPAATLRTFCGSGCVAGISFEATATGASGRASLAIGFLPDALNTIAHELGHAHGLAHSPGCGAGSADANFPYVVGGKAYIGWVGWDNRTPATFLDPATVTDIMAYCTPQWVSDYVYSKWTDRVATLNGQPYMIGVAESSAWRVLNVIGNTARWGISIIEPEPASGDPVGATVLDAQDQMIQEITVYRTNISIDGPLEQTGASYMIPMPASNWASIQIGDLKMAF
jgi:hypothetical protein